MIVKDRYDRRKILFHPQSIAELLDTGDTWPVNVNTGFTTYCNHSCVWCSSAYTTRVDPKLKNRNDLLVDTGVWKDTIATLAERGTRGMIVAGQGEPLLHPDAVEMLEFATGKDVKYMLFSNGERLSKKYYDAVFNGCLAVRFSIDAGTAEMHQRWHAAENANGRGHADFDRIIRNIRDLVAEKRRQGTVYPHIGCQMICSSLTEADFEPFAALFADIGVDYVVYKSLQRNESNDGITISSFDIHESEEERARSAIRMRDQILGIKERYETESFKVHVKVDQLEHAYVQRFNGAQRYNICRAHPLNVLIEPDGNVYLCIDHGGNPEFKLGNIYEQGIAEIWESDQRREVVAKIDLEHRCQAGCFLDETNVVLHELANPAPDLHHELI
jgi:radical SAM protein with 4Fe4S-binding SPASM domain